MLSILLPWDRYITLWYFRRKPSEAWTVWWGSSCWCNKLGVRSGEFKDRRYELYLNQLYLLPMRSIKGIMAFSKKDIWILNKERIIATFLGGIRMFVFKSKLLYIHRIWTILIGSPNETNKPYYCIFKENHLNPQSGDNEANILQCDEDVCVDVA